MIKFKMLIHKGTGTVIQYEKWLEHFNNDTVISINQRKFKPYYHYEAKEMLFNEDFTIVYDSEFTTEELNLFKECIDLSLQEFPNAKDVDKQNKLQYKIDDIFQRKEYLKFNYNIDL